MLRTSWQRVRRRIPDGLVGAALLFGSTTVVNAGNYVFNLVLGRWLGPAVFADVSLIITLFLVVTFVTVALQMTAARFAAGYDAAGNAERVAALRRTLVRVALGAGLALVGVFGLGAPLWQMVFHTESPWLFVIFALGIPCYFVIGVERGVLQGQMRFNAMAISFQVEMWARLLIALALVAAGWAALGATAALTLSLGMAWLIGWYALRSLPAGAPLAGADLAQVRQFAGPVLAALGGQILINNSDVLVVKNAFSAEQAGLYAALALIGRIVFFATWSIVTVLFPIVARRHQRGEPHRHLLYAGFGIVVVISLVIIAGTAVAPGPIIALLFGAEYLAAAPLLASYATATALYALSNVVVSYRLALNDRAGSMLALVCGIVQALALAIWHDSLAEVVFVQIYAMAGMLGALLVWDAWLASRPQSEPVEAVLPHQI